jgi:hypothetical protein
MSFIKISILDNNIFVHIKSGPGSPDSPVINMALKVTIIAISIGKYYFIKLLYDRIDAKHIVIISQ